MQAVRPVSESYGGVRSEPFHGTEGRPSLHGGRQLDLWDLLLGVMGCVSRPKSKRRNGVQFGLNVSLSSGHSFSHRVSRRTSGHANVTPRSPRTTTQTVAYPTLCCQREIIDEKIEIRSRRRRPDQFVIRVQLSEILEDYDRLSGDEKTFSWYERGAFTRYDFNKESSLPSACTEQDSDPVATFDALHQLFEENYGFFEERKIDWHAASALDEDLSSKSSDEELMSVFQEMLTPFNDGHVYVFDPEGGNGFLGGSLGALWDLWAAEYAGDPVSENPIDPRGTFTAEMQTYVLEELLKGEGKSSSYDLLHWGWLNKEVGYLDVHAMGTFEAELGIEEADMIINDAMEEIMSDLADAEAIVIDARFNQGGYDTIGYAVASWFSTKTKVVSQKKAVFDGGWTALQDITIKGRASAYQGPVYLLTSGNTVSAAETFSLAMRELPQVTLVGTRTYGSLSDAMGRLLPNGWLVSLSNEIYQSPAGEVFEAKGIPPAVEVKYDDKLSFEENLERTLERTLELIDERTD